MYLGKGLQAALNRVTPPRARGLPLRVAEEDLMPRPVEPTVRCTGCGAPLAQLTARGLLVRTVAASFYLTGHAIIACRCSARTIAHGRRSSEDPTRSSEDPMNGETFPTNSEVLPRISTNLPRISREAGDFTRIVSGEVAT
jgi:hypothetical protein